jgi:ferritin-like metal-binding protein YciE
MVSLLDETLAEEEAADKLLGVIAKQVNTTAKREG